ncbi:MAG: undecaprenyldiphospho-muramoylpentapeptide beta-N-acetylglucosaminyltransferase [Xanthomonadales bacterium]|nr:undecaprenyldiphospho-muramoylpentapeptide beta-N-acetylglucosaminyltransferase [Xanthomonadales bacterium]
MSRPVLIMAGGTGGHIFPGLAVAQALVRRGVPVAWLGAEGGMETRLVPAAGIELHTVPIGGLRGKSRATLLLAPLRLLRALARTLRLFGRLRPRAAISFGGYAAGPGGLAAHLRRVPLLVHEQNAVPGWTNRKLAQWSARVLTGFPEAIGGGQWVGNPVRPEIAALPAPQARLAGRGGPLRVLVLGGSLGAGALNAAVPSALARLAPAARPLVRHQCGRGHEDGTRSAYAAAGVEATVEPFIADMAAAYGWADLVLCRAGALTLAELCAAGVGALLVPYPHAVDDHQTRNAAALVEAGAAELLPQARLDPPALAARVAALAGDRVRLLAMAVAARGLARPDAAEAVADACLEVAR